jgi:hypothetical protein
VKMVRLFSNSEYIDIVCGEMCGSVPRAQRISVLVLLVDLKDLKCCYNNSQ